MGRGAGRGSNDPHTLKPSFEAGRYRGTVWAKPVTARLSVSQPALSKIWTQLFFVAECACSTVLYLESEVAVAEACSTLRGTG